MPTTDDTIPSEATFALEPATIPRFSGHRSAEDPICQLYFLISPPLIRPSRPPEQEDPAATLCTGPDFEIRANLRTPQFASPGNPLLGGGESMPSPISTWTAAHLRLRDPSHTEMSCSPAAGPPPGATASVTGHHVGPR
ncbi:hypothetical protein CMUS01_04201 [Colletotrichum musicola]|uniref:Uncharacterized protein n=1 Tax=Colletotrichum musicola TaxID=2175873 RepID=A0A8H6KXT3_9PEZI|nr:hypothetical protein CMUS01_04201 [Colletotrichum musicola]